MKDNEYLLPGIAAIVLTVLYPLYWILGMAFGSLDFFVQRSFETVELEFTDFIWLLIGALAIYLYLQLMRNLKDHFNYNGANALLLILVGLSVAFYFGLFVIDVAMVLWAEPVSMVQGTASPNEGVVLASLPMLIVILTILYGVADILLGLVLLMHLRNSSTSLALFGAANFIMGVFELSLLFSFVVILLYPITTLLLAIHFLRRPDVIEVV